MTTPASETVEVRSAGRSGRGAFAARDFAVGDVIERCHIIPVPCKQISDSDVLSDYVFGWSGRRYAVALGNGSLYNFSDWPNADCVRFFAANMMHFVAVDDIPAGREITISHDWEDGELEQMTR